VSRIIVTVDDKSVGWIELVGINHFASSPGAPISRGEVWRADRADDGRVQQFESQMAAEGWLLGGNE
jgi:hypothetical protein